MNTDAEVYLWGTRIALIHLGQNSAYVTFEYDRDFQRSGIEVSPIQMPLSANAYRFPDLPLDAFHGVPGLLADSLPDRFGNAVIDSWLASQGRTPDSFNVVERLCYTGARGMGALEYVPVTGPDASGNDPVDLAALVRLASNVLKKREAASVHASKSLTQQQLLQLGTSAGGARAKALIAWNPKTGDVRSGQISAGDGYEYWLIKFDGVSGNGDHALEDIPEYTRIEYAYYLMAVASGIQMNECRRLEEGGRNHFMTKRFDREKNGRKLHMQTLAALAHISYQVPGLCSYEMMAQYARRIGIDSVSIGQLFRRMVFNVIAVNQDDHVKNFSFLMDRSGRWSLAPAYDITFACDPANRWLSAHQMTINGKSRNIGYEDLIACGRNMGVSRVKSERIIDEVASQVSRWEIYARQAGVREKTYAAIQDVIKSRADAAGAIRVFDSVGAKRLPLAGSTVSHTAHDMKGKTSI